MIKTADEAVEYIHSLSRFGKKSGLSNIKLMTERLGNPQDKLKFIHIAGTNGKGSVSNMLKNILMSHSYKVGHYVSPYIEFFGERICINNEMISDEDLVYYTNRVRSVCEDITPIEFEFITAAAFLYYYDKKCDVVVLETGLGGRFDATNVIKTSLEEVITSIGLDHTAILGNTLDEIAFEKAGIIKPGTQVVAGAGIGKSCLDVIKEKCISENAVLTVPEEKVSDIRYDSDYTRFVYKGLDIKLSLKGTYQIDNAVTAVETALLLKDSLGIDKDDILIGLSNSKWKCRFEVKRGNPDIVSDGAHNSHAIKVLMESMDVYYPDKKRVFLFSMLNEKDYEKSIELISDKCDTMIITTVPSYRQTSADEIFEYARKRKECCLFIPSPEEALKKAADIAGESGVVCIFGSLYLSGYLRKYVFK